MKKSFKKLSAMFLSLILLGAMFALTACGDKTVKVTGIELNETSIELEVEDTFDLVATVNPTDATNKKVIFSSDDEDVATVSASGKITAESNGLAIITVTTEDGEFEAFCTVKVDTLLLEATNIYTFLTDAESAKLRFYGSGKLAIGAGVINVPISETDTMALDIDAFETTYSVSESALTVAASSVGSVFGPLPASFRALTVFEIATVALLTDNSTLGQNGEVILGLFVDNGGDDLLMYTVYSLTTANIASIS